MHYCIFLNFSVILMTCYQSTSQIVHSSREKEANLFPEVKFQNSNVPSYQEEMNTHFSTKLVHLDLSHQFLKRMTSV